MLGVGRKEIYQLVKLADIGVEAAFEKVKVFSIKKIWDRRRLS